MNTFFIVATASKRAAEMSVDLTARIEVQAKSLSDAYKKIRKQLPEFRHAYLRPE